MTSTALLPSNDFDKSTGLRNACLGIEHARISRMIEVR